MKVKKFQIAVICQKCGREVTRSKEMTRDELESEWQSAVLTASMYLPKCKCSPKEKPPFLRRTLKVVEKYYKDDVLAKERYLDPKCVIRN